MKRLYSNRLCRDGALDSHPQANQIIRLDSHQVPGARHLDPCGYPSSFDHDIETLAAMQPTIVVVKAKSDIDPIPLLVVDQYAATLFHGHIVSLLISFGHVVLFKLLLGNPFWKFKDASGVQF